MKIKPNYQTSFIVCFKRGKDIQKTEIVEATQEDIRVVINKTFKDRFLPPKDKESHKFKKGVPFTEITFIELDNVKKISRVGTFCYTSKGKEIVRNHALVYNLSPREVRIRLEDAINGKV